MATNPVDEQAAERELDETAKPEAPRCPIRLDKEDPAFLATAYATYAGLRAQGPLVRAAFGRGIADGVQSLGKQPGASGGPPPNERYFVTRYDEAVEALLDARLSSDFRTALTPEQRELLPHMPEEMKPLAYSLLMLDPPDHTRLRKLVQPNFTARSMEALRPRIQRIVDGLLDEAEREAAARGESAPERTMDLRQAFAYPLPVAVISDLLGIPEEDRARVHGWTERLSEGDPRDPAQQGARMERMREFGQYLRELFERKRQTPAEDMISQMVHAQEDGDRLSAQEMMSMVLILFFAGHITTVSLLGSGVVALLTQPGQYERVRADPSLIKGLIEETLRYWGPVDYMSTPRIAKEDVELAGTRVCAGERLSIGLASANRDPARFENPEVFDVTRPDAHRHLAFGKGIHVCIGAPLARLEGEIAFATLLRRYPALRLAVPVEDLRWAPRAGMRGFDRVPVRF